LTFREAAACFKIREMRDWQRRVLEARGHSPERIEELLDLWTAVLVSVRSQTTTGIFDAWFSETVLLEHEDGQTVIGVPSERHQHLLGDRMRPLIERALRHRECEVRELVFEIYDKAEDDAPDSVT